MNAMHSLLAALLLMPNYEFVHESWISRDRLVDPASGQFCCGEQDCEVEKVTEVAGGYLVSTGEVIPVRMTEFIRTWSIKLGLYDPHESMGFGRSYDLLVVIPVEVGIMIGGICLAVTLWQ